VNFAGKKVEASLDQLRGRLNFVYFIKSSENERIGVTFNKVKDKPPSFHTLYRQFLDYIWFYGIDEPTIICEGKTDNIYLKAALRARAPHFPDLAETKGGVTRIRPRFFKYSDTAAALQDLSGGTGELNNLLSHYRNRTKAFKGGASQPVIIVVDNDSGAKPLFGHIFNLGTKAVPVDGSRQFYYIYENLYVVPVPKVGGADTPIEMLFEKKLLSTVLNGKHLDLTSEKDPSKYYFKNDFAVHVVKKGGTAVNFDGFDPLLSALVAVKLDYAKRIAAMASSTALPSLAKIASKS
jgi:RNA-directed DNA polymerase